MRMKPRSPALPARICAVAAAMLGTFLPMAGTAAAACPRIEFGEFLQRPSKDTRPVTSDGQNIHFGKSPIFSLRDIARARLGEDGGTVFVDVKPDAAMRLKSATTGHSGSRLALVVDDVAVMAIIWEGDYGLDDGSMQFSFRSGDAARQLVSTISRCAATSPG